MTCVVLRPRTMEGLKSAPNKYRQRINKSLDMLRNGLFPPHTKKLEGVPDGYRTRVGRWRILFVLHDQKIDVADIFLKKGVGDYRRRQ